jgi:hypothetical protein
MRSARLEGNEGAEPWLGREKDSSVTFALRHHISASVQERRAVAGVVLPVSNQRSVNPFGLVAMARS